MRDTVSGGLPPRCLECLVAGAYLALAKAVPTLLRVDDYVLALGQVPHRMRPCHLDLALIQASLQIDFQTQDQKAGGDVA
jgi:hypothetical protein